MPEFSNNPLWLNLAIFAVAAAAVWYAGVRLERIADAIAVRTGLDKAFIGLVVLAGVTSLPEIATMTTAAWAGYRDLMVHDLLGTMVMNTMILVIVDASVRGGALTSFNPSYSLLMQGVALLLMLAVIVCWMALGAGASVSVYVAGREISASLMGVLLLVLYLFMLWTAHLSHGRPRWQPVLPSEKEEEDESRQPPPIAEPDNRFVAWPRGRLTLRFSLFAGVVLVAGWTLATTGQAIAQQTGIAAGFVGATLLATATSLPEVSTTFAAARHGNYSMAMANIFGSNMFGLVLFLPADLLLDGSLFSESSRTAIFTAGLGAAVTCLYLWGMLEHRDRTIWRLGIDSWAVLVLYVGGIVALYFLSGAND